LAHHKGGPIQANRLIFLLQGLPVRQRVLAREVLRQQAELEEQAVELASV
jgi:hypothetical protein